MPQPDAAPEVLAQMTDQELALKSQDADATAKHIKTRGQMFMLGLVNRIGLSTFNEIVDAVVAQAKGGDTKAAALIFDRLMGKPEERVELIADIQISEVPAAELVEAEIVRMRSNDDWRETKSRAMLEEGRSGVDSGGRK